MSERQKNWGVTVLVSEIKRIEDRSVSRSFGHVKAISASMLSAKKKVKWRTLDKMDVLISTQIGLLSKFLQLMSFL